MHQTGFDVNTRAAATAAATNEEAVARVVVKTAAPMSTAQTILTQGVRMFDRALFGGARFTEQRASSASKDARSTSSSDEKSSGGAASELRGGNDVHARVEGRESKQDQSGGGDGGGSGGKQEKSDRNSSEGYSESKIDAGKNQGSEARGGSSNANQNARSSHNGALETKEQPLPERLEEVVAEVTAAMTELGSAGEKRKKKSSTDDLADFAVGFTLVEQDDEDPKFRRFLMYAEDDDLMVEPWIIRFNDDEIFLEIHVRDPKQIPLMMEHAAEMETDLREKIGIKVVLAFKTFSKGAIL
jgi:hypothetical protein